MERDLNTSNSLGNDGTGVLSSDQSSLASQSFHQHQVQQQREIKFRFWLGHTKKMTYEHSLIEIAHSAWDFTEDIISLQYTGLKDKNGKEIYEGDIVAVPELYETPEMTSTNYINWLVVFKFGMFTIETEGLEADNSSEGLHREYEGNDGDMEVIGNIYEHPHLLTNEPNDKRSVASKDAILTNPDHQNHK